MSDSQSHAGEGPADPPANGGSPRDWVGEDAVPATMYLRDELSVCSSLMGECVRLTRETGQQPAMQAQAAATAAKLASASAQVAAAIARLADAETRQRLATGKLGGEVPPPWRPPGPYRPRARPEISSHQSFNPADWDDEEDEDDEEKSTNNPVPRVWSP